MKSNLPACGIVLIAVLLMAGVGFNCSGDAVSQPESETKLAENTERAQQDAAEDFFDSFPSKSYPTIEAAEAVAGSRYLVLMTNIRWRLPRPTSSGFRARLCH